MTYATLKTAVETYMHRSDMVAKVPGFVQLAEAVLFRELNNVKELQLSVSGTTTGGYAALPDDFGAVSRIMVTVGSTTYSLDYSATPIDFTGQVQPGYYSFENDQLRIYGAGDGQAYTLFYTPLIVALSDSAPTNWILANAYDLYFYASCVEGARHVRNQPEIDRLSGLVSGLLDGVRRYAERRGQPTTGSLQIKPRRAWTN
jgi:hypothetical protein